MRLLYDYIFGKPRLSEFQDQLAQSPLFENFSFREIQHVLEHAALRTFAKDEHVFFEGDVSSALYLVLQGSVDILSYKPKRIVLAHLTQGTFFGEIGVVYTTVRSATALVTSDTLLLCLFKHDVDEIITHNPHVACKLLSNIARIIAQRLIATNKQLKEP
ncbi:MAG TPA: cyclic nucleotide-binding domain-containing protein [Candidatus Nanoarchaeia archaeon]|nr:cyclic nucleotide-binding domain-containing protein [Candidatus Nanoarchaeia archaeon]